MKHFAISLSILVAANSLLFGGVDAASIGGNAVISVKNGPFAGDYKLDPKYASCMHSKKRANYSMGFKNFDAHGANMLAEGGMEVYDVGGGPNKSGTLTVTFGDPDAVHTTYEISRGAAKLAISGPAVTMSLEGATKSGIRVVMTVECGEQIEVP